MVHGEHDLHFKRLNSQLCMECEEMSGFAKGRQLSEATGGWQFSAVPGPADVMTATAASSGRTLRQLAGSESQPKVLASHCGIIHSVIIPRHQLQLASTLQYDAQMTGFVSKTG